MVNLAHLPPELKELLCPITHELMTDPVLCTGDGFTYEASPCPLLFAMTLIC
jgi:hypothetical protein